jgi:ribosome biogenesis GTPase
MREVSRRRMKGIKRYFEHKEEQIRQKSGQGKFQHRSVSGDARQRESTVGLISCNADQMVIVVSFADPPFRKGLVDRFLVMAAREGVEPLIVVNKLDLLANRAEGEELTAPYRAVGYRVILTSTATGEGIDLLRQGVKGRSSILAGHSGVGKSSILRSLAPGMQDLPGTGEVSPATGKGRHTTTSVRLYRLEENTLIFDLPGIKVASLHNVEMDDVSEGFPDISSLAPRCRFRDCIHVEEPGCAVRQAVGMGEIPPERYRSYLKVLGKAQAGRNFGNFLKLIRKGCEDCLPPVGEETG